MPMPMPLPLLQPLLRRIVRHTALRRPEIFDRLGAQKNKRYLIDPTNIPFVLLLSPDPTDPVLRAYRRPCPASYDARIGGTLLTLLDMVEGRLDGDALFFTRDLNIEGDTEAVVALRNALDDVEGSIIESAAEALGAPGRLALAALRGIREKRYVG